MPRNASRREKERNLVVRVNEHDEPNNPLKVYLSNDNFFFASEMHKLLPNLMSTESEKLPFYLYH